MAFQGNGDEVNGHANAYLFSTQPLWTSSPYGVAPAPNVPTPPLHPPNNNGVAGSSASGRSRRRRKFIFCEICNQGVDRPSAMEVHMRSHLNWRPYTCRYCGQGFTKGCNKKRHEETARKCMRARRV